MDPDSPTSFTTSLDSVEKRKITQGGALPASNTADDPYQWSLWKKIYHTAIASVFCFTVYDDLPVTLGWKVALRLTLGQNNGVFDIHPCARINHSAIQCLSNGCDTSLLFLCFRASARTSSSCTIERELWTTRNLCAMHGTFRPFHIGSRILAVDYRIDCLSILCGGIWQPGTERFRRHNGRYLDTATAIHSDRHSCRDTVSWTIYRVCLSSLSCKALLSNVPPQATYLWIHRTRY